MKLALLLMSAALVSGCATQCERSCIFGFGPGNPVFNTVADSADRDDPCQTATHSRLTGARLKPDGHVPPDYCRYRGRSQTQYDVYDRNNRKIGEIRTRN